MDEAVVGDIPTAVWTPLVEHPQGPPRFTVRALVIDTFARYGADPIRLVIVSANLTIVSIVLALLQQGGSGMGFIDDLVGAVNGAVSASLLFAIAGGGPSMPPREVLVRGFRRSPRVLLTFWAIGISAAVVGGLIELGARLFLQGIPPALFVATALAVAVGIWIIIRLALALPAVVNDQQGVAEGLSMSRAVTARAGIWGRIGVVALLLIVLFVASFVGIGALVALGFRNAGTLVWIVIGFQSLWAPVVALFLYSAYRRLVVPGGMEAAWSEPQVAFEAPPFGRAARAIFIGAVALAVVGAATFVIAAAS
jgi:hypothetical protein